jgi:hypothetical protein
VADTRPVGVICINCVKDLLVCCLCPARKGTGNRRKRVFGELTRESVDS